MKPDVTSPEWVAWFEQSMHEPESTEPPPESEPTATVPPRPALAEETAVPRRRTPVVVVAAVLVVLLGLGAWWWTGRGDPDPAPRARQIDAPARSHPPAPVRLAAGAWHTQVRILATGVLVVQEWHRTRSGSVAYERHRLTGALERSGTRALARLGPAHLGRSTYRTIDVVGATVLSLACTSASQDVPVPCGADAGERGWRLVGSAAPPDAEVLVQLDLP